MSCSSGLHSCSCRSGNTGDMHLAFKQTGLSKWKQSKLYSCGKASGIGELTAKLHFIPPEFGQSIHIAVRFITIVLCKINNLKILRQLVIFPKLTAEPMPLAHEPPDKSLMNISQRDSGIACGMDPSHLHLRVVDEEPHELPGSVTRPTDYSGSDHNV